jgi:hypothetical protein
MSVLQIDANTSKHLTQFTTESVQSINPLLKSMRGRGWEDKEAGKTKASFQMPTKINLEMQSIQLYIFIEHKRLVWCETINPYIVSNLGLIPQITSLHEKTGSFYMLTAQSSRATTTRHMRWHKQGVCENDQ